MVVNNSLGLWNCNLAASLVKDQVMHGIHQWRRGVGERGVRYDLDEVRRQPGRGNRYLCPLDRREGLLY